jgi:hypothetical protein
MLSNFAQRFRASLERLVCGNADITADVLKAEHATWRPGNHRAFLCVPCMISSLRVDQPDGGEGLAKPKGVAVRQGLKEGRNKFAAR